MIKFENFEVMGWEHAIRGMRNPKNSWGRSDTGWVNDSLEDDSPRDWIDIDFDSLTKKVIGPNDHSLMMRLRNAGTDHRKFMRMITVYVDITAPLYWWKEFDTYKVGTVANSCSTMHTIHEKEFTWDDFSVEKLLSDNDPMRDPMTVPMVGHPTAPLNALSPYDIFQLTIHSLNANRLMYLETNDRVYWDNMIQMLPTSYNQKRTVMMNYEVLANIYKSRKNHKLKEWHFLCDWAAALPYGELITGSKEPERLSGTEGEEANL